VEALDLGKEIGAVATAVKERDLVASGQGSLNQMAAEENRAADDQEAHRRLL
jgi:hypothetical protein